MDNVFFSYADNLKPLRIAAVPGVTLEVAVQDELRSDVESPQQQQLKPIVTIGAATSTIRRNPAYGDELAALENYNHIDPPSDFAVGRIAVYGSAGTAIENSSSSTSIDRPRAAAVGRNPAYGGELAALENYNHIDRPNTSARGPQLIPDIPMDTDHVSSTKPHEPPNSTKGESRAPQFHPEKTPTWTIESPRREGATSESVRPGDMDEKDGRALSPNASKQDAAEAEQPGYDDFQKGLQLETGLGGVRRDYGMAMECYLQAAEQGHTEAPYNIAQLYEYGRGVSKDESKAVEWYIKTAERGHLRSQTELGYRYARGKGVPRDLSEAFEWRLLAAEQGDGNSQLLIAHQYGSGQGVRMD